MPGVEKKKRKYQARYEEQLQVQAAKQNDDTGDLKAVVYESDDTICENILDLVNIIIDLVYQLTGFVFIEEVHPYQEQVRKQFLPDIGHDLVACFSEKIIGSDLAGDPDHIT
jgi:hypothetical protein